MNNVLLPSAEVTPERKGAEARSLLLHFAKPKSDGSSGQGQSANESVTFPSCPRMLTYRNQ